MGYHATSLKNLSSNFLKKIIRTKLIEILGTEDYHVKIDTIIEKIRD